VNELWQKPPAFADVGSAQIAWRSVGRGEPLLLVHGWPFSSWSFRRVLPRLAEHFTCFLPDTPGLGESVWYGITGSTLPASGDALPGGPSRRPETDFRFAAQAERLRAFADASGLARYSLLAFDTGATIARQLALIDAARVSRLVLLNTEIPGHRPPWIPLFQRSVGLPGSRASMRLLLRSRRLRRSGLGFGGCFFDRSRIDDADFLAGTVAPLLASERRLEGAQRYLAGIDWGLVDGLARRHAEIAAPVLFVWGEDDPTFPIERARAMTGQLRDCRGLVPIPRARLLVHEERPDEVANVALPFLSAGA
jgi:pimeloyl-ACP methyl ester carboxylesterase